VVDDQFGAPTGADLLADLSAHVLRTVLQERAGQAPGLGGIYHVAAAGTTTWFDYARFAIESAKSVHPAAPWVVKEVVAVASSAFPTVARRPFNSRLDTRKFQTAFGLHLPPWQAGVARMISEMNLGTPQ